MGRRLLMVVALRWTPSRASLLRIGLCRVPERGGQEPVRPFLREPARVGEDDLDLGVADLEAGQDTKHPPRSLLAGEGDLVELNGQVAVPVVREVRLKGARTPVRR